MFKSYKQFFFFFSSLTPFFVLFSYFDFGLQLMNEDLLQDLALYKKSREKAVSIAARSLIGLFREVVTPGSFMRGCLLVCLSTVACSSQHLINLFICRFAPHCQLRRTVGGLLTLRQDQRPMESRMSRLTFLMLKILNVLLI